MPVKVTFTSAALADIDAIAEFLATRLEPELVSKVITDLYQAIRELAGRTLLKGNEIKNLPSHYREWLILKNRYRIYFVRSNAALDVARIQFVNQPMLESFEILRG